VRILLVSHNVPPHGGAGTETYTADLARALADRGHMVTVFAARKDIALRDGSLHTRVDGRVEIREVVNNLYHADFRETWENRAVESAFEALLADVRPQVVHVQHLLYLSSGLPRIARAAGARVVFTLHDYWLTCPRFGQRVHHDGAICHTVDFARCGTCLVQHAWRQPWAARAVGPIVAALRESTGIDLSQTARRARLRFEARDGAPAPAATSVDRPRAAPAAVPESAQTAPSDRPQAVPPPRGSSPAAVPAAAGAAVHAAGFGHALPDARAEHLARAAAERWHALRAGIADAVDLFLAPSRFLRARFLDEWGLAPERIEHLPFGFDRARFGGARTPAADGGLRVGFLGTLAPHKGPHVLLEAWLRLPAGLRARGRLAVRGPALGGPAYEARLLELARAGGAELSGPLARADVPDFLRATDLLVVPSLWFENSPLAIQEAIACRTPLLVSDLGGMAELVTPGENGLRFPAGDVAALAQMLGDALAGRAGLERLYARPIVLPSLDEHVDAVLARYAAGRAS
jgi:glycosyltransferase involved in cell wall biosynthesis